MPRLLLGACHIRNLGLRIKITVSSYTKIILIGQNDNSFSKEGFLGSLFDQKDDISRFENVTSAPFETLKELNFWAKKRPNFLLRYQ